MCMDVLQFYINCMHLVVYLDDPSFSTSHMIYMRSAGNSDIHVISLQGLIQKVCKYSVFNGYNSFTYSYSLTECEPHSNSV